MQGFDSPNAKSVEIDFGHSLPQNGTLLIVSSEIVLFLITALWHFCQKVGKTLHQQSSGNIGIMELSLRVFCNAQ